MIQDGFAPVLHRRIAGKATQLDAIAHAVGGTEDHVNLVVSVPPSVALSEFIRQVKGNSPHFMNDEMTIPSTFAWQGECGIMSLEGKQLDKVVGYVREQRQHHAQRTTIPVLERMSGEKAEGQVEQVLEVASEPL